MIHLRAARASWAWPIVAAPLITTDLDAQFLDQRATLLQHLLDFRSPGVDHRLLVPHLLALAEELGAAQGDGVAQTMDLQQRWSSPRCRHAT